MSIAEKLTAIAENEQRVYDTGYMRGSNDGYVQGEQNGYAFGFDEGKKAEYDAFWDEFQDNGNRTNYEGSFYNGGWTSKTFKPKYSMFLTGSANSMFYFFSRNNDILDLTELFQSLGITLDTSGVINFYTMFSYARISRIPTINTTSASTLDRPFRNASFTTSIDKIILKNDGSQTFSATFDGATVLANITFEGVIGKSISFKDSPLTKASITNIVEQLSSTASGQTCTFKKTAKEAAFTADEWATLIGTKTNWTISLV